MVDVNDAPISKLMDHAEFKQRMAADFCVLGLCPILCLSVPLPSGVRNARFVFYSSQVGSERSSHNWLHAPYAAASHVLCSQNGNIRVWVRVWNKMRAVGMKVLEFVQNLDLLYLLHVTLWTAEDIELKVYLSLCEFSVDV